MATKNPETPKSPEIESINEDLGGLKTEMFSVKDRKDFETLSNNPTLKKGLNKLFNKSCKQAFSEEWKHYEKLNVWKTIENILKKYPDLWFEISWKLWLSLSERKFSNLSLQQKLNFTALHESIFWKNILYKKNPSSQDILSRINQNSRSNFNKINRQFERKNVKNFLDLEKTLKEFGLASDEIWKVKEYLVILKKHPEFIYWRNKTIEAGSGWWYAIVGILAFALWALWMHYIDNIWKINPESTIDITRPEIITVEEPESILKFMVTKWKFGKDPDKPIRWRDEIKMFTINDDDAWWKKFAKEKINTIQSREIVMDLSWDVLWGFDLDKWCQIDIKTNYPSMWKWVAFIQLPEPDIMILNDEAKVVSEDLERIHVSEFKNAQEKLRQRLRGEAEIWIKKDEDFRDMTKREAKDNLLKLLKNLKPYWMNIEDVEIRFFNPEKWETLYKNYDDYIKSLPKYDEGKTVYFK